jgi:hypothetical protein
MERTGAMDERFFLYFEDVDWCFRMWRAGFEVHYTPAAQFVHEHRRASAKGAFHRSFWLHLGSLISFYEKWGLLVYLVKKWRGPVTVFLKWLVDMVALSVAFGGAYFLRLALNTWFPEPLYSWSEYRPLWLYACLLTTVTFLVTGRYRRGRSATDKSPLTRLHHVGTVALLLLASTYLSHQQVYSRAVLLLFVPLFAVTATVGEGVFRWLRQRLERGHLSLERSLLVGPPEALQAWLSRSAQPHLLGIDPVGFLTSRLGSEETEPPPLSPGEVPWLGRWQDVLSVVDRYRISQVVFWGQPQPPAADASLLARLHRRRIRLRWRLDEAWLVAAGTRAEPFGGQLSAVLEPGTDAQLSDWLRRGADVVAGILVALVAAVPCLWLCLRGGKRRHGTVTVSCTDPWGEVISYRLVVSRDGRVRSLWWQWWLAWSLVRGRASLVGLRPVADGSIPEWPRALPAEPFWHTGSGRPGLTGSWAVPREKPKPWAFSSGAAWVMMKGMLAVLLRDPGGFGRLPPPDQPPSPEQMESRSFREVE